MNTFELHDVLTNKFHADYIVVLGGKRFEEIVEEMNSDAEKFDESLLGDKYTTLFCYFTGWRAALLYNGEYCFAGVVYGKSSTISNLGFVRGLEK